MPQNAVTEKLDRIYVCKRCGVLFLFRTEVEDHSQTMAGHAEMREFPL